MKKEKVTFTPTEVLMLIDAMRTYCRAINDHPKDPNPSVLNYVFSTWVSTVQELNKKLEQLRAGEDFEE